MPHRRAILRGAVGAAGMAPFGLAGRALAAAPQLSVSELPGGLSLITGAGGAVVAAKGPEGAVLVDCGGAESAGALAALALQKTGARKVARLYNTCWRLEHTGGNDLLAAQGARIFAHENTRLWMGTEIDASRWENKVYPPRAPAARPTETFYTTGQAPLGSDRIDYGYLLQAHTDGDMYVHFRKANVLAVGAAVAGKGWTMLDLSTAGWIGGHVRGLEALTKVADDKTTIVTADGVLLTRADVARQFEMYKAIMTRLQTMMESGYGMADVLKGAPAADYVAERGDPTRFLTLAYRSFWGHVRQFRAV